MFQDKKEGERTVVGKSERESTYTGNDDNWATANHPSGTNSGRFNPSSGGDGDEFSWNILDDDNSNNSGVQATTYLPPVYGRLDNVRYSDKAIKAQSNGGSNAMDWVQGGLDVAGLVPAFEEVADGINALIYTARGDYVNAGLSAAAMIPFAGWAATGAKATLKNTSVNFEGKNR